MRAVLGVPPLLLALSGLFACGSSDPADAACADVWMPGETLPDDYLGCDGNEDRPIAFCVDGGEDLYTHSVEGGGVVWARLGGTIDGPAEAGGFGTDDASRRYNDEYQRCRTAS